MWLGCARCDLHWPRAFGSFIAGYVGRISDSRSLNIILYTGVVVSTMRPSEAAESYPVWWTNERYPQALFVGVRFDPVYIGKKAQGALLHQEWLL